MAGAAGWGVRVLSEKGAPEIEDQAPGDERLVDQGRRHGAALNLLMDMVAKATGERPVMASLQQVYDRLPWEQREVAARHLLPEVRRAGVVSRQSVSAESSYIALLRRMPLFATMSETELALLASRLRAENVRPGQVVVRQGDRGTSSTSFTTAMLK